MTNDNTRQPLYTSRRIGPFGSTTGCEILLQASAHRLLSNSLRKVRTSKGVPLIREKFHSAQRIKRFHTRALPRTLLLLLAHSAVVPATEETASAHLGLANYLGGEADAGREVRVTVNFADDVVDYGVGVGCEG